MSNCNRQKSFLYYDKLVEKNTLLVTQKGGVPAAHQPLAYAAGHWKG